MNELETILAWKLVVGNIKDPQTLINLLFVSKWMYLGLRSLVQPKINKAKLFSYNAQELLAKCSVDKELAIIILQTHELREKLGSYNQAEIDSLMQRFRSSLMKSDIAMKRLYAQLNYYNGTWLFQVAKICAQTINFSLSHSEVVNALSKEQIEELKQLSIS